MYEEIKKALLTGGAAIVGTSYQEETPFDGLHYAISFGIKLSDAVIDTIGEDGPSKTYFHHYRTVNSLLDQLALKAVIDIEKAGFSAANVPASQSVEGYRGLFSHKKAAVAANLGWIGKNALFISGEIGPRVRLATVFTDMVLPVEPTVYKDGCGDCTICRDMCPSGAIGGKTWTKDAASTDFFDPALCSAYMKDHFGMIGRGSVCGICMRFCPYGKNGLQNR